MTNHYKIDGPAVVAFSGGATSGFMLRQILDAYDGALPKDVVPVFANTGLEHPKTYNFIRECETRWGVEVHWVEYAGKKTWKRVNYETASRNGEPFSLVIDERQYLPNPVTRFCTVELKIRTMHRYAAEALGFQEYTEIVGLRKDEPRRVHRIRSDKGKGNEVFCPMYWAGHDITHVEEFWKAQPFRLEIDRLYGNCVGCFLKGRSKIERIAEEDPSMLAWWAAQEEKIIGSAKATSGRFRYDRPSYAGLIQMAGQPKFDFGQAEDTIPCHCTE